MCNGERGCLCSRERASQREVEQIFNYSSEFTIIMYYFSPELFSPLFVCCVVRYERLAEQEEMNAQQQRRRLFAELEQERDKMAAHWNLQKSQLEQQQTEALVCVSLCVWCA